MKTGALRWIGILGLACAACCAAPLLAAMGIGGALTAGIALFSRVNVETVFCLTLLSLVLLAGVYFWIRKRRLAKKACNTTCRTDASCCS